jgi:hypothetical protein
VILPPFPVPQLLQEQCFFRLIFFLLLEMESQLHNLLLPELLLEPVQLLELLPLVLPFWSFSCWSCCCAPAGFARISIN